MGLFVRNQRADGGCFSVVLQHAALAHVTDTLGGLLVQDVVAVHALMLDLTSFGQRKALGCAAMGLLLRHVVSSFQNDQTLSWGSGFSPLGVFTGLSVLGARTMIM